MSVSSEPSRRALALAYLQVLLAGALWGTSGPFSVALYRMGIPPGDVAFLRPAAGTAFLLLFVFALRRQRPPTPIRTLFAMLGLGGMIVALFQFSYQMSTASVGVPATVALLYLAPAFVVVTSVFLFGERLTPLKGLLVLISITGVWLTVLGARGVDVELTTRGIVWGGVCGLTYGSYTLFGKYFGRTEGALLPLFWSTLGGTLLLGLGHLASGDPLTLPPTLVGWALLAGFGLLTMALAALLLFRAMQTIEAGRATIGTTIEPLVAALLAMFLLDQTLTPRGWVGLALLLVGVGGAYMLRAPAHPGEG